MKLFTLVIALFAFMLAPMGAISSINDIQALEMQLENDIVFQKMVRIYDYDGALIKEFPLDDVVNNKISLMDHMILEESDFAFDHLGDYYYLGDSENLQAVIN